MRNEMQMLPEDRAAEVWQRAAELQAEAAKRDDAVSPPLHLLAPADASGDAESGFRVADIRAAAVQAGISPEFVTLALAESEGIDARGFRGESAERAATRILGTSQRGIEVVGRIVGEPAALTEALKRVLPAHPYYLTLSATVGADPLNGGVLIFDLPGYSLATRSPFAYDAAAVGVKQLRLMLRNVGTEGDSPVTEVSIAVDLRRSARHGSITAASMGGMAGALGGAGGVAVGLGVLALGTLAALPALAGAALVGAPVAAGFGALYRYYIRKLTADLHGILRSVDAQLRTGGAFAPPKRGTPLVVNDPFQALDGLL